MFVLRLLYISLLILSFKESLLFSSNGGSQTASTGTTIQDPSVASSQGGQPPPPPEDYQSIIEHLGDNGWLRPDDSLATQKRLEQVKEIQTSSSKTPYVPMPSLYDPWLEQMTSYPSWVEVLNSYPPWNHTEFTFGYPSWKILATDINGLALALADGDQQIGNEDAFKKYVDLMNKEVVHPEATLQAKGDPMVKKAQGTSSPSSITDLTSNINPLLITYILLQQGVNVWETKAPVSKLKGMCYILAAKAHITIAKADSLGYDQKVLDGVRAPAKSALDSAKQADGTSDPKALTDLYNTIAISQSLVVRGIGSASYDPKKAKPPVNKSIQTLIMDVDQKISYIIAEVTQTLTNPSSTPGQLPSLKDAVRKIQLAQQGIADQNSAAAAQAQAPKPPAQLPKKKPKTTADDDSSDDESDDEEE